MGRLGEAGQELSGSGCSRRHCWCWRLAPPLLALALVRPLPMPPPRRRLRYCRRLLLLRHLNRRGLRLRE